MKHLIQEQTLRKEVLPWKEDCEKLLSLRFTTNSKEMPRRLGLFSQPMVSTSFSNRLLAPAEGAGGPFEGGGRRFRVRFLGGRTRFGPIGGAIPIRNCLYRLAPSLTAQNQLDISAGRWNTSPSMVNSVMLWD